MVRTRLLQSSLGIHHDAKIVRTVAADSLNDSFEVPLMASDVKECYHFGTLTHYLLPRLNEWFLVDNLVLMVEPDKLLLHG